MKSHVIHLQDAYIQTQREHPPIPETILGPISLAILKSNLNTFHFSTCAVAGDHNALFISGGGDRLLREVPGHSYEDPEGEGGGVWVSTSSQTTLSVPAFSSTIQAGNFIRGTHFLKQCKNVGGGNEFVGEEIICFLSQNAWL